MLCMLQKFLGQMRIYMVIFAKFMMDHLKFALAKSIRTVKNCFENVVENLNFLDHLSLIAEKIYKTQNLIVKKYNIKSFTKFI